MLPNEAIEEFKELYRNDTGVLLSDTEATEQASALFNALEALLTNEDQ